MHRIVVAALLIAACSSGPQRVGGQPSWRKPGDGGDPAAPVVTTQPPVQVKLAPAASTVRAYNDPPRTPAPSSPVGDAIAAEIAVLAPKGTAPFADGRLYGAAADLAAVVPVEGVLPYPVVEFALQHHGIIEPSPNMLVVWGPLDQPALLVENLRPRLAELLHGEPLRRFGIGTAERGDRGAVIVMLQASFVDTQPFPRSLPANGGAKLVGRVLAGFTEPEAFVTRDDGTVDRIPLAVGSGFFQHGHTYIGHAAACAGALAVQKRLHDDGLLSKVTPLGNGLERRLRDAFASHPHVGEIRGRGLFWGIELVEDRATKKPFDPKLRMHARIKRKAMEAGLMCYPMGGALDGVQGDHVLLAPPFILDETQLDELVDKLGVAIHSLEEQTI